VVVGGCYVIRRRSDEVGGVVVGVGGGLLLLLMLLLLCFAATAVLVGGVGCNVVFGHRSSSSFVGHRMTKGGVVVWSWCWWCLGLFVVGLVVAGCG